MTDHVIVTIGDPHLGHRFRVGVPHHRMGEREFKVNRTFEQSLETAGSVGADLCVCMGDLFETHTVSNDLVEEVAHTYRVTAESYPGTTYVLLKGNHDWHRDKMHVSSFDILSEMISGVDNIVVAGRPQRLYMKDGTCYGLFPWMPPEPRNALEWADYVFKDMEHGAIHTVFGHWDSAWSEHNIIPTRFLADRGVMLAYSGHDHTPREEVRDGLPVIWTGSMLPYGRAQDPEQTVYKTVTLEEYLAYDQNTKYDLCFAVILEPGEELPYRLDAWETRVISKMSQEVVDETLEIGEATYSEGFDMRRIWDDALKEVPEAIQDEVAALYKEHMA